MKPSCPWGVRSSASDASHHIHLCNAVRSAYLAAYHALARSNADLLVGASDAERSRPEWLRAYHALGGDYSDQRLQGDYSGYPEAIRGFADTFLELHHQRLLADEDISATFTAAEAQAWVERSPPSSTPSCQPTHCSASPSPLRYCSGLRERSNPRIDGRRRPFCN